MTGVPADVAAVCARMRAETEVAITVHEKPDADALGAARGLLDTFAQLGVRATLHIAAGEVLPQRELLLGTTSVSTDPPPEGLPLYVLDCGSLERAAVPLAGWRGFIVTVDHHHDNRDFGDLRLVRGGASSTSELVCELARALGLEPSPAAAAALYAGISFDTGHFRHDSTAVSTFDAAAWLTGLGVDVTAVYAELYEDRSFAALRLWARVVLSASPVAGGKALVATVTLADFAAAGAEEHETEGIVESLRVVTGVEVAALVKEQSGTPRVRVSLRSSTVDVSAVAALQGGGGHRLAAGFSSAGSPEEVTAWLSSELERLLSTGSC